MCMSRTIYRTLVPNAERAYISIIERWAPISTGVVVWLLHQSMPNICSYTGAIQSACSKRADSGIIHQKPECWCDTKTGIKNTHQVEKRLRQTKQRRSLPSLSVTQSSAQSSWSHRPHAQATQSFPDPSSS